MIEESPSPETSHAGGSGGGVFGIVMVVGALVFGLAVGYRLGGQDSQPVAIAPTQATKPAASPSLTAEPTPIQPSPPPTALVQGGLVSEVLRQAYYLHGAGTSVCDVSGEMPTCHSRRVRVSVPDPTFGDNVSFEELMGAGPVEHIGYDEAVIVEDIQADQVVAELYTEETFAFPQPLGPVVQDQNGVYYINVSFDTGKNVVVVRSLSVDRASGIPGATWHANVIAFDVAPPPQQPP